MPNSDFNDMAGEFSPEPESIKTEPSKPLPCFRCGGEIEEDFRTHEYVTISGSEPVAARHCRQCDAFNTAHRPKVIGYHPSYKKEWNGKYYLMTPERQHAEHSPSSLLYKSKCSGFRNDQTRDKTAANSGEFLHLCTEKENLDLVPPKDVEYDDFGRRAVQLCINYVRGLRKSLPGCSSHKEPKLNLLGQWGYADEIIISADGKKAILVDYKFAWNAYDAEGFQFKAYTLGIIERWPSVQTVEIHVLHPFLDLIDTCSYSTEDFPKLEEETALIIAGAERNDPATFRTGTYCTYCGQKASCPKLGEMTLQIAQRYQPEELEIPAELTPENITDPQIVARGLIIAPVIEEWAKKIKKRGLEMRLQEGIEIPGFELKERSAAFSITDAQAAWEAVKDKITPEEYAGCAEVKIGALEKVYSSKFGRGEKTTSKTRLRDLLLDGGAARSEGVVHYLKREKISSGSLPDEN